MFYKNPVITLFPEFKPSKYENKQLCENDAEMI